MVAKQGKSRPFPLAFVVVPHNHGRDLFVPAHNLRYQAALTVGFGSRLGKDTCLLLGREEAVAAFRHEMAGARTAIQNGVPVVGGSVGVNFVGHMPSLGVGYSARVVDSLLTVIARNSRKERGGLKEEVVILNYQFNSSFSYFR